MKTLRDITELKGKRILLRADFDCALRSFSEAGCASVITEPFRILKQKPLIDFLTKGGAKVLIVAHISAIDSFASLIPQLHILLGREIGFIAQPEQIPQFEQQGQIVLLDNIRKFEGEMENSEELAQKLASGIDFYINNAFAVCHRKHASVSEITNFLPSYAGPLIEEETGKLGGALCASSNGKVLIIGGAKAATKAPVIKNFIGKAEKILLGGVVANDFLKAKGVDVGSSVIDDNYQQLLEGLDLNNSALVVPEDFNIFENKILDIGPKTEKIYSEIIKNSKMVIWNGPMGMFEDERFAGGTKAVAEAVAGSGAIKIAGGGDTIAALNKFGLSGKFDFVSTGGGAMLEFLAGNHLPGLESLGYYE